MLPLEARKAVPQTWCSRAEGCMVELNTEGASEGLWYYQILQVERCMSTDGLLCEQRDFVPNPERDNASAMKTELVLLHSYWDPCSIVLNVLEILDAPATAVAQSLKRQRQQVSLHLTVFEEEFTQHPDQ